MPDLLDNIESKPEGPDGRSIGTWIRKDGRTVTGLLEWTAASPEALGSHLTAFMERLPTDEDVSRSEEARTLKIDAIFREGRRTALVYLCSQQPIDLRNILLTVEKPSGNDRRALSRIIATQVRSLHVHFQLRHAALQTQSFVFFGDIGKPDLSRAYVLDWGRPSSPGMYQHPEYDANRQLWSHEIWSLMMIMSEIAEWRPLDEAFQDEKELLEMKAKRKELVTNPGWKGGPTAAIFKYGFQFLEQDRPSRWDIKRFYDKLCELLAPPPA